MIIAICDDNAAELDNAAEMLNRYGLLHPELFIELETFSSPIELTEKGKPDSYDIYLLDVIMPEMTGIQAAQKLREAGITSPIVFLTTSRDFAVEAFSVRACDYIIKPYDYESFASALDEAVSKVSRSAQSFIMLRVKEGYIRADIRQIVYSESHGHKKILHFADGTSVEQRTTTEELYEKLSAMDSCFYQMGASYILNLKYIKSFNQRDVTMTDGSVVNIPRGYAPSLKRAYFDVSFNEF